MKQLKHLEHIEDQIFGENYSKTIDFLFELRRTGMVRSPLRFQKKIDGSPSVIVGRDPLTRKVFVGTKSVFNKTPKVNYTFEDIDRNHPKAGLNIKLRELLKYANEIEFPSFAIQGDLLFTRSDLKTIITKDALYVTFCPNTISYGLICHSMFGAVEGIDPYVLASKRIGVAWHTSYHGTCVEDMEASFSIPEIKSTDSVFNMTTNIEVSEELPSEIIDDIEEIIFKLQDFFVGYNWALVRHEPLFNKYVNSCIRDGKQDITYSDFLDWYNWQSTKDIALSSPGSIRRNNLENKQMIDLDDFINNWKALHEMFFLWKEIVEVKEKIINILNSIPRFYTFMDDGENMTPCHDEGYVIIHGTNAVKLISRLEFSRNNFLNSKRRI